MAKGNVKEYRWAIENCTGCQLTEAYAMLRTEIYIAAEETDED